MTLARLPAATSLAIATASDRLPAYVLADDAHRIINMAGELGGTRDLLLVKCLWQSGGRVTEVLSLRPADVDATEGALKMPNLKQKKKRVPSKRVYVSYDLVAELRAYARDARISPLAPLFQSQQSKHAISATQAWRIVQRASILADVQVLDHETFRPANPRDFRHGAAVDQIRSGIPLSEVSQQLGHARIDSTLVYTKLSNPERRQQADRRQW